MNFIKTIFRYKLSRAWFITTVAVTAVLITATILTAGMLNPIVKTALGGDMPILDNSIIPIYKSDYSSKRQSKEAGDALNVEIAEEGFTLLLNEEGALPIATPKSDAKVTAKPKVSVFGKNSVNLVLGGSGSGGISGEAAKTIFDGLEDGGFEYNPALKNFYENNGKSGKGRSSNPALTEGAGTAPTLDTGETPLERYTEEVENSYEKYSDAALVVISRIGGESFDLPRTQNMKNGGIAGNHYLQLDENEYALLDIVTVEFKKVIVVLNTLTAFQCDFIAEYNNTASDKRIDAVLWIGGPGTTGALAIGGILNGSVNPSGRTVDIYPRDFTKDPTWMNFGDGSQASEDGTESCKFTGLAQNLVVYEEGVYVGYRYYETRGINEAEKYGDDRWYGENVIFPFGYGLSYTDFTQRITDFSGALTDANSKLTLAVEVENTGNAAGRDAVQLYVSLPYYEDGIEKPYVQLVDYAKTEKLAARGGKETVTFTVNAYDLASYDYNDANNNGFKGYELDPGEYTFFISGDSHVPINAFDSRSVTLAGTESIEFGIDPVSGTAVVNRYTADESNTLTAEGDSRAGRLKLNVDWAETLSRIDFEATFPTPLDNTDRTISVKETAKITDTAPNTPESVLTEWDERGMPAVNSEEKKIDDKDAKGNAVKRAVTLRDLIGKTYDDPLWKDLLDRLNGQEMLDLVNKGAFQTGAITKIDKNLTNDSDGPIGFVNFITTDSSYKNNTTFASEIVIASTWNKDLAYRMGRAVGDNAVWGAAGGNGLPYSGWYAPAVNIHRSPFSGRNFEYYSEDPVLSGKMAVNVVNGAKTKGVYTYLKHFALNDQETNRSGVATFVTEQALREIYLKPFELAVKGDDAVSKTAAKNAADKGITNYKYTGSNGMMSSFNRIGFVWTGGDYRLMTEILRGEWGFRGLVICDYKTNNFMGAKQMIYAGNDLILASLPFYMWGGVSKEAPDFNSVRDMWALRTAAHNILYAVANSNSMNVRITGYIMPWWQITLIVADCVAAAGFAVWGFFAIRRSVRKEKSKKTGS